jgi:hypothetical protein
MMRRKAVEPRAPEPIRATHLPALALCLNATGYAFILQARGGDSHVLLFLCLGLTALSWYGLGRLILHRREPCYRAFGVLLAAVNAVWTVFLILKDNPEGSHHREFLGLAAGLFGLGVLITLHSFLLRGPVSGSLPASRSS